MALGKQKIKLIMTADTVGGVWTYCMELCRSLQPYHADVHLVTMGGKMSASQQEEVRRLKNVTVYETAFRLEWMQDPWSNILACGNYLLQLEKELQPDLIHLNCFAYGSLPFLAPVVVVAHSDVVSWFEGVKGEQPGAAWNEYFHCVREGLHGADTIIAPSAALLQTLRRIYGLTGGTVIYNGRDANSFSIGNKERFVFSMGRIWDEAKNVRLLADAAAAVNCPVTIAGDNRFDGNHFETTPGNVVYTGQLTPRQVAEQLSKAAIFVLPAKYEPFGLSALEAAYSGCALVLGDIPSLREIWQDAAIYCNTDDAGQLAKILNGLVEDDSRRALLATRASLQAMRYSADLMAKKYWTTYRHVVAKAAAYSIKETV